ncbi:hypothetical protein HPB50_000652 [Hyalomma asiaticum]|uniref:Uncharacterized protein n=1 Tax=Hyalomma asiaticum TaxID=266040 RepID=A0ACB7T3K3_HYAAI|nr:hypothetical protein HPB50_000652 [Hyalomma asiaticum]
MAEPCKKEPETPEKAAAPTVPTGIASSATTSNGADCKAADPSVGAVSSCANKNCHNEQPSDVTSPGSKRHGSAEAKAARSHRVSEVKRTASGSSHSHAGKIDNAIHHASKDTGGPAVHSTMKSPARVATDDDMGSVPATSRSALQRRLREELADLVRDAPPCCSACPAHRDDLSKWRAVLSGPKGTPYEGGTFSLEITFPEDYPNTAPKIKFITKIYHPNVSSDGDIGLDVIHGKWSPGMTVDKVLLAITDLMKTPDMNNVLHQNAATHYKEEYDLYDTIAREWTQIYAKPEEEELGVWPPVI